MSAPTNNTNGIVTDIPANIATPPVQSPRIYTYFFNSSDGNRLYYKDDAGAIAAYAGWVVDPCLCEQAAKTMCQWNQGLLDKTLAFADYQALITAGATFTATNGTDTYTVTIGIGA